MTRFIDVALNGHAYKIAVGYDTLKALPVTLAEMDLGKDALIITSPVIEKLHGKVLEGALAAKGFRPKFFTVPDGEASKSATVAIELIERIAGYDLDKQSFIIAFGGGVIGDLAGYVAAVYKRGVPYIQVPTTLLAQVDSAIGGKVGIDLSVGKNLVGAFYQPKLVWSDVSLLQTLDERQIRNGLAEAVKYGIICDKKLFSTIAEHYQDLLKRDPVVLTNVIINCAQIKANIVTKDERETKGLRTVLNFGHTLGHAIETAGHYERYHHGEAVALGMRMASHISCAQGFLSNEQASLIEDVLTKIGLPQRVEGLQAQEILRAMRHDKKFKAGKNRFVLALRIGDVKVVENVPMDIIKEALEKYMANPAGSQGIA